MTPAAGRRPRWVLALGVVASVHAAALSAPLWWGADAVTAVEVTPATAIAVTLAAAPQAPAAPAAALPAGPLVHGHGAAGDAAQAVSAARAAPTADAAQSPVAVAVPQGTAGDVPVPTRIPVHAGPPAVRPAPQAPPTPAPVLMGDALHDSTLASAPPAMPASDAAHHAAPQTASGRGGHALATWQSRLVGHLEQYRRYPRAAERARLEGVAYVRFSVAPDGAVADVRIGRGSGSAVLDAETLSVVRRASPVPPPPDDASGMPVEVMVPVSYFMPGR